MSVDGVGQRRLHLRVGDVEPAARRVDRVGVRVDRVRVERLRARAGAALKAGRHAVEVGQRVGREAAEQDRPGRVEVVAQVPACAAARRRRRRHRSVRALQEAARRRLAERDEVVAPELAEVLAVSERDALEQRQVEPPSPAARRCRPGALIDLDQAEPGPGRSFGVLDADDPVEAGQRLPRGSSASGCRCRCGRSRGGTASGPRWAGRCRAPRPRGSSPSCTPSASRRGSAGRAAR